MEQITIGSTGVLCSQLAFGCAGAFHLPRASDRSALLDAAVDAGFTHLDVAPMYGMGRAEVELAPLLRRHGDRLSLTTKFGIRTSPVGSVAGRIQGPVRRLLAARPQVNDGLQRSGAGPTAAGAGRLLYRGDAYLPEQARASLGRSLSRLGRGTIDLFILHDPSAEQVQAAARAGTFAMLDDEIAAGRIRNWGIALHEPGDLGQWAGDTVPFLQFRDDVLHPADRAIPACVGTATYGVLAAALPLLLHHLSTSPAIRMRWIDELGIEDTGPRSLASVLLREAVRRNPFGPVLFTTTKPHRLAEAADAVTHSAPAGESDRLMAMVAEARAAQSHS